jgi:hypothetical protein
VRDSERSLLTLDARLGYVDYFTHTFLHRVSSISARGSRVSIYAECLTEIA